MFIKRQCNKTKYDLLPDGTLSDLDSPKDLEVTDSTETSLVLQWQKPEAKITGYTLEYVSRDGQTQEVKLPPTATNHALDNLTPDTLYSVALTAERGPKNSSPVSLSASTGEWSSGGTFILKYLECDFFSGEILQYFTSKCECCNR